MKNVCRVAAGGAVLGLALLSPVYAAPAKKVAPAVPQATAPVGDLELVHTLGPDKGAQLQKLVDRFNAANPGTHIVVSERPWTEGALPHMLILGERDLPAFLAGPQRYRPLYQVMKDAGERVETLKAPAFMTPTPLDASNHLLALPVADLLTMLGCFGVAGLINLSYQNVTEERTLILALLISACLVLFHHFGHYSRRRQLWQEFGDIAGIAAVALVFDLALLYLLKVNFSRVWVVTSWLALIAALPLARTLAKTVSLKLGTRPDLVFTIGKTAQGDSAGSGLQPTGLGAAGLPAIRLVADGAPASDTALTEGGTVTVRLATTPVPAIDRVEPDLAWHFEDAIASGSEFRIADARRRLSANTRWIEKGTAVLHELLADPEVPFELARVAQRIGLAQSRLARVDAAFQRAVNKIEAQRVTLGGSGISSSDVAGWLRGVDARALAALAAGALAPAPELTLLAGGHELLDRAEPGLSEDARRIEADTALPPPEAAPANRPPEQDDLRLLQHFSQRLARLAEPGSTPAPLASLVAGGGFPAASYRLSLLALLADGGGEGGATPADGPIGEFMRLPLDVLFEAGTVKLGEDEIAAISAGLVGARGSLPAAEAVPVLDAPDSFSDPA